MSKLKTEIDKSIVESLVIFQAATSDGYWANAAHDDMQYVFLLGQLKATRSIHASHPGNHTRLRIKRLEAETKELKARLLK